MFRSCTSRMSKISLRKIVLSFAVLLQLISKALTEIGSGGQQLTVSADEEQLNQVPQDKSSFWNTQPHRHAYNHTFSSSKLALCQISLYYLVKVKLLSWGLCSKNIWMSKALESLMSKCSPGVAISGNAVDFQIAAMKVNNVENVFLPWAFKH